MEDMPSKDFDRNDFEQEIRRLKAQIETGRINDLVLVKKVPSLPVVPPPAPAAAPQAAGAGAGRGVGAAPGRAAAAPAAPGRAAR